MKPKLALIWINYNSSHIINVVKKSLRSLFELDYPEDRYEVIVIDNASSDDSWLIVKELTRKYSEKYRVKAFFYRSSRNFMYTGGNELGLRIVSKDAGFVGFVNNDVLVEPGSAGELIEYLQAHRQVGAVQGVLYYDSRRHYVNSAGLFMDTLFNCHMVSVPVSKPLSVSYTHGAYSLYSIDAIKKCLHDGKLFFQCVPAFFDDSYIGVRLWNLGYMSCALPVDAGIHLHSATFKRYSLLRDINSFKSLVVMNRCITQSHHLLHKLHIIKKLIKHSHRIGLTRSLQVYREARKCAEYVAKQLGEPLNIGRMPHIPLTLDEVIKIVLGAGRSVYSKFLDGEYLLRRACLKNLCPE